MVQLSVQSDGFTFRGYPMEIVEGATLLPPKNLSDSLTGLTTRDFVGIVDDLALVARSVSENREFLARLA